MRVAAIWRGRMGRAGLAATVVACGLTLSGQPVTAATTPVQCAATSAQVHFYAPGHGRTVALTFDDGPGPSTSAILDILEAHHIHATFFNLGDQLSQWPHDLHREFVAGEAIGDHTWDHAQLNKLTTGEQRQEILSASTEQQSIIGVPPCVFRPPYGDYDHNTLRLATRFRMATWLWSVDPQDWKAEGSGSQAWVDRITEGAEAGLVQRHPVVLLHNTDGGNPATVAALPAIIRAYRAHGYRFVMLFDPRSVAITG